LYFIKIYNYKQHKNIIYGDLKKLTVTAKP